MNEVPHIDYTLEGIVSEQASALGAPEVQTVLALDVESLELRCMKGDCPSGDYVPG